MTPPLVVVERHRNRKSVPDCDAFQKNAERCKNLTCFALRDTKAASPYRSDAPAYRSEQRLRQRHGWPGWRGARPRYFRCADSRSLVAKTQTCLRVSPSIFDRAPAVHPTRNATTTVRGQTTAPLTRLLPAAAPCWPPGPPCAALVCQPHTLLGSGHRLADCSLYRNLISCGNVCVQNR